MSWAEEIAPSKPEAVARPAVQVPRLLHGSREQKYAQKALDSECVAVTMAGEGNRNNQLNTSALKLGQFVASGHLSDTEVRSALFEAGRVAGLNESEINKTITSGMSAGMKQPRHVPEPTRARSTSDNGAPPTEPDWMPTDDEAPNAPPSETNEKAPIVSPSGKSFADVFDQWGSEGPLIHEATGIAALDELTGGGPVYGTRWYVVGAPDAGKTALCLQVGHEMAERGVCVGFLAVDEEPGDLVTRFAQRAGWRRDECERRYPESLQLMREHFAGLPIRFYGDTFTIEKAAADLASFAAARAQENPGGHPHGPRALLVTDSLQTVSCDTEATARTFGQRELSTREAVTERAKALRASASKHRLISLCTSEMNRAAYRTADAAENTDDLASAAESRAVEYSGRVVLALRSVAGEKDLVELRVAKNKHGPRGESLHLRIDRGSQVLSSATYAPPASGSGDRAAERNRDRVIDDAVTVAEVLLAAPGLGSRELRAAVRARTGIRNERTDTAVVYLGDGVKRATGAHGARPMTVDLNALPPDVRARLETK